MTGPGAVPAAVGQRAAIRMNDQEVAAFLAEPGHTMTVATLLSDGCPHLTAVWYGFTADGTLGFTTYPTSQKATNLGRDPRITVLVECGQERGLLRGVQIVGRPELSWAMKVKLELSESVSDRYGSQPPTRDRERALARRVAVLIAPLRVASWDHRKLIRTGTGR